MNAAWRTAIGTLGARENPDTLQVYVHFPYCLTKCRYCMYWSRPIRDASDVDKYVSDLLQQLDRVKQQLGIIQATNAYCGGGTPSLLSPLQLEQFLAKFADSFRVAHQFTFESSPSSLDADKISILGDSDVNRVSLGVQSMDPGILKAINRGNPPREVIGRQIESLRSSGLQVNVDLVLDLPGQAVRSFRDDLLWLLETQPDTVTVYRYWPVQQLPHEPGTSMRFSTAVDLPTVLRALKKGFVFFPSGGSDESNSVIFIRNNANNWRTVGKWLRSRLSGTVLMTHVPPGYQCFDNSYSHIMGLGPGSFSHIHGYAWCRDVSSLQSLALRNQHVYYGTRLTGEVECLVTLMLGLARGKWFGTGNLQRAYARRVSVVADGKIAQGIKSGVLQSIFNRIRLNPAASRQDRDRFLSTLMPELGSESDDLPVDALRCGVNLTEQVQLDLIPCLLAEAGKPLAIWSWLRMIGLQGAGDSIGGGTVSRVKGKTIDFKTGPGVERRLTIMVDWEKGQACYGRSRRFALSWVPDQEPDLTTIEQQFLEFLLAKTQDLDPS
ncbi:radical SAM protein [Myxococcota bacterium]